MTAVLTIGGTSYTFIENNNGEDSGVDQTNTVDERQRLLLDVIDYTGSAHFVYGEQVTLTDPVLGIIFNGIINTDKEVNKYPSGVIRHSIDCIDLSYFAGKRTYTRTYDTPTFAGKIVVDHLHDVLAAEGIAQNYALHADLTDVDFNQGILSGTVGALNVGDGDLELAPAGANVTITEATTADFAAGTLTNVIAANNQLSPTTQNALKFSVILPTSNPDAFIYAKFWSGSLAIGTNDTFFYDVWVSDQSPAKMGGACLFFSDNNFSSNVFDQNGISINATTDLSGYAVNQWYTRQFSMSPFNGKTITSVLAINGATSVGQYTWYIRNCYIASQSGNKFFSITSTAPQLNPPTIFQFSQYIASTFSAAVVATFDPNNSSRVSPSHSVDAVKLLKSSSIVWSGSSAAQISISYNGGSSWIPCTNSAMLPGMPIGSNVAGLALLLKETFTTTNDPTTIPALNDVTILLGSAPNATKSDIVTSFLTQANWNTGTHSSTQADVSGNLELAPFTRNWNDNLKTGQTAFFPTGTTDSASGGIYTISCPTNAGGVPDLNGFGTSRLDFLGTMLDFTIDCDIKSSSLFAEVGITYRQIFWNSTFNNTFGYFVGLYPQSNVLEIGYGSNSNSESYTILQQVVATSSVNTFYHLKLVVNGSHHQVYFNNATTPTLDVVDSTYTQAGGIGLRAYQYDNAAGHTSSWDNLVLAQQPSGTWTGPSTSVSSLGTCGGSVITWTESGTANPALAYAFIQSTIDGGTTWQQCISGQPIPNLNIGDSLTGKSVQIRVLLGTQSNSVPTVTDLVWRVLGAYPGSSGTRSTIPLGLDTVVRANQSGAGTSSDGQSYAQTGTGTVAIASNELTITNTTGDVYLVLGSRTGSDMEGTHHFALSTSVIVEGLALRYVNVNNFYRLSASTTTLTITKKSAGVLSTLKTAATTLSTGTYYNLRFRVTGGTPGVPVLLEGRVWADGIVEPTSWNITASD